MARRDSDNIARYWRDRHRAGLSLMHADFRTQAYAPHRHEALVIAVTELGGSVVKSRGRVGQADASVLSVFNPCEPHSGWMGESPRWRYRALYLEQDALDDLAAGLGLDGMSYFTQNFIVDRELSARFITLHRALEHGRDALRERELLLSTFGTLFGRHGGGGGLRAEAVPRDRARLRRVLELVHARLGENLSLSQLGDAAGLTEFQLIGLFKRTTGLTPHSYVTQLRLDAACRALGQGAAIADVALACGFYDQSALTRYFKRTLGLTPLQFARAVRA